MKLIVGLGNPGPDYSNHRHNIGSWVVEGLARNQRVKWENPSPLFSQAPGELSGEECRLVRPLTFMNESGQALRAFLKLQTVALKDLIVVHDDMDLVLGKLRWSFDSGFGGHNGVKSIIDLLGSQAFHRLRLGIGRGPAHKDPAQYVLEPFSGKDLETAEELVVRAGESLADFVKQGLAWVQNRYH